jgi:dTDP-4-dehydrorhamnose 3,5-epimerase
VIFRELDVAGAYVLEPERQADDRGFFARTFCVDELAAHRLETAIAQISVSHNERRGTLRGMHYQAEPHGETKLVRCTRGSIYDVVLDLRSDSATSGRWVAVQLSDSDGDAVYVPRGCAHGFLTLEDDTDVEYVISTAFAPDAAAGVRFDDPTFAIEWPFDPLVISERDRAYPMFDVRARSD